MIGFYMALVSVLYSGAVDDYKVVCGQEFSNGRFIRSIDGMLSDEAAIERELVNCPEDKVLVRFAFLSYLNERHCNKAANLWLKFDKINYWHRDDFAGENVAICFYDNKDYESAISFFSKIPEIINGNADISDRHIYAESLYGIGDANGAIGVLKSIAKVEYDSIISAVDKASYIASLVSLSRILYSKGDLKGSIIYSNMTVHISPYNVGAYEVLLASIARSDNKEGLDLESIYCKASKLKVDEVGDSPLEIKEDLSKIRQKIYKKLKTVPECN